MFLIFRRDILFLYFSVINSSIIFFSLTQVYYKKFQENIATYFGLFEAIFRLWFTRIKYILNKALKWRYLAYIQQLMQYIKI